MYVISGEIGDKPTGMACGLGQTIDLSTWTWEDWALAGLAGVVVFSLLEKGKAKATRAIKRRRSSSSSSGSGIGSDLAIIGVLGAAFLGYLYFSGTQGSAS